MIINALGALGLFLMGMWLMTEGLKIAGGKALSHLLSQWTSNRLRGLLSGVAITALVQSSSAVTVATLGFVNAGLLNFRKAVWVVFGSNLGTTFTAWIVTLFGFSFKIDHFALPLVGLGAALKLFHPKTTGKSFGTAIAGFGILFLGIAALQEHFSVLTQSFDVQAILDASGSPTLLALLIGFALTVLTQSSSAGIAIILTAVASNIITVESAAAAVIGANLGTTSTALLASIGATADAKRLAWAHVSFNIITGIVAFVALPFFWWIIGFIAAAGHVDGNPTLMLAIFHTFFNGLGIILMWPLENRLSRKLLSLFHEEKEVIHTRLDKNVLGVPDLAIRSVRIELEHLLQHMSHWPIIPEQQIDAVENESFKQRLVLVNDFIGTTYRQELTQTHSNELRQALAVSHHLGYAQRTYLSSCRRLGELEATSQTALEQISDWITQVTLFQKNYLASNQHSAINRHDCYIEINRNYEETKQLLFDSISQNKFSIQVTDTALQAISLIRRYAELSEQAQTAYEHLDDFLNERKERNLSEEAIETIQ